MIRRPHPTPRRGVAAVEMAFVTLLFVVPLLIGMWEIGRLVHVQQVVTNAAREGARYAGQANTLDAAGNPIQVRRTDVQRTVYQYLVVAGFPQLVPADVTTTFGFTAPTSGGTTPTEPYLGEKGQPFTVTVSIPWAKVRWLNIGLISPTTVQYTVRWQLLTDDAFSVNTNLPNW